MQQGLRFKIFALALGLLASAFLALGFAQPRRKPLFVWTPAQLSSLKLWLDADNLASITKDGSDLVSQWNDLSGNAFHAAGPVDNFRKPTWVSSGQNGRPVIRFDGGDYLECTSNWNLGLQNFSAFVHFEETSVGNYDGVLACRNGANNDWNHADGFDINVGDNAAERFRFDHNSTGTMLSGTSGAVTPAGAYGAIMSSNSPSVWVDGSQTTGSAGTMGTNTGGYILGARWQGAVDTGYLLNGDIHEVVVVGAALSTSDREKLEGYLAHKWGTQSALPGGHVYKNAPPTS